jgi:UDPglucose--hexose-1-phosphate uridylyltransferase
MQLPELSHIPHRRRNVLTGEWVLVSPHRTIRPWQGEISKVPDEMKRPYEPDCYLCPGNKRANGEVNPAYTSTFVFTNDFSALLDDVPSDKSNKNNLFSMKIERGICRVVNFTPRHDLTLAEMKESEIEEVITAWQNEFSSLGSNPRINYVQIFENKGSLMGNSNPHPHGQIWAQESIPNEPLKELKQFTSYFKKMKRSLLADYLKI